MKTYKVKSGQNLFDVALTLYGSVEGVFDLLASNDQLSLSTPLESGMVLVYNESMVINENIPKWFDKNNVKAKNGSHQCGEVNPKKMAKEYLEENIPGLIEALSDMTEDEKCLFWESYTAPRMIVDQRGGVSTIRAKMKNNTIMMVDWGDYDGLELLYGEVEVEHCYNSANVHKIVVYGNFECEYLDLTEAGGLHYPLSLIVAERFEAVVCPQEHNTLITEQ